MNEYVWLALYTLIELLGYWSVYVCILKAGINKTWWRYAIYILTVLLVQLGLYYLLEDIHFANLLSVILGCAIPTLLISKRTKRMLFLYPIIIIVVPLISNVIDMIMYQFIGDEVLDTGSFSPWKLLSSCLGIIICITISFIMWLIKFTSVSFKFSKIQYITLLIGIICCSVLIVCNELYVWQGGVNKLGKFALASSGVLICIVMLVLSLIQGILLSKNARYKEEQLRYDYFLKLQEQNINALIDRDEKMRRFRHDMYGHMSAIRAMAQESKNVELESYVNIVVEESSVFKVDRYTGNVAIDAIISDMYKDMQTKNISFYHKCDVYLGENINIFDMCTIMYNTLKNAIESCNKLESDSKQIFLTMYNLAEHIYIDLSNTCVATQDIDNIESLQTTKNDSKNHGIGTKNIIEAVKRNGGIVKFSIENGLFKVNIVL